MQQRPQSDPKALSNLLTINSSYLISCNSFNDDASSYFIVMDSKVQETVIFRYSIFRCSPGRLEENTNNFCHVNCYLGLDLKPEL